MDMTDDLSFTIEGVSTKTNVDTSNIDNVDTTLDQTGGVNIETSSTVDTTAGGIGGTEPEQRGTTENNIPSSIEGKLAMAPLYAASAAEGIAKSYGPASCENSNGSGILTCAEQMSAGLKSCRYLSRHMDNMASSCATLRDLTSALAEKYPTAGEDLAKIVFQQILPRLEEFCKGNSITVSLTKNIYNGLRYRGNLSNVSETALNNAYSDMEAIFSSSKFQQAFRENPNVGELQQKAMSHYNAVTAGKCEDVAGDDATLCTMRSLLTSDIRNLVDSVLNEVIQDGTAFCQMIHDVMNKAKVAKDMGVNIASMVINYLLPCLNKICSEKFNARLDILHQITIALDSQDLRTQLEDDSWENEYGADCGPSVTNTTNNETDITIVNQGISKREFYTRIFTGILFAAVIYLLFFRGSSSRGSSSGRYQDGGFVITSPNVLIDRLRLH